MAETATAVITRVDHESPAALAGFGAGGAADGALAPLEAGVLSTVVREEAEIKAAIVLARQFPRVEAASYNAIIRACDRASFAEAATYRFPRGGQQIEGPSVDLAREMARSWKNIRWGLRIVSEDERRMHIKGFAYDMENNNYVEMEDKFAKLVQRKNRTTGKTDWVQPDERDLRELVNRRGAILVRNAILQLIPPDVTEDAVLRAKETMRKAAAGEVKQDRQSAIRRLVGAFDGLGVSPAMLEGYLQHSLEIVTEKEIADLRSVWKSISDGNSRREDYFTLASAGPKSSSNEPPPADRSEALARELAGKQPQAPQAETKAPEPAGKPETAQEAPQEQQQATEPAQASSEPAINTVAFKDLNGCQPGERVRVAAKVKRIVISTKELHVYSGALPPKPINTGPDPLPDWVQPDVDVVVGLDVLKGGKFLLFSIEPVTA